MSISKTKVGTRGKMAKLYFRYSAMNSGKTTSLIQTAHNYEERDQNVVVLKPRLDSKAGDHIQSRIGASRAVDILLDQETIIKEAIARHIGGLALSCVLVDEAQFLEPSQVDQLFWYAVDEDTPVIAYGLRTDFQTRGFPGSTRLLELAHDLQELKTICRCGKKAVFNGRKLNGDFVSEGSQVAIDGEASIEYESLCAKCYKKNVL
jgi:thymidine kinase